MHPYNINYSRVNKIESRIFQFLALSSIICVIPAFQALVSATMLGWMLNVICICTCLFFFSQYSNLLDRIGWLYCISLIIIIPFHYGIPTVENAVRDSIRWINIILLFYLYRGKYFDVKLLVYAAFIFYFIECSLCIIEKIGHFYFINYTTTMTATNLYADEYDFEMFRSRGLLLHPLYNANVISIFMGFILVSNKIKRPIKIALLFLGGFAIWGCNSRACIAIWLLILLYRFFLYNTKIWHILLGVISLWLIVPWLVDFIQSSGAFGRFNMDFSDSSSETRIIAYTLFLSYPWTIESIIFGLGDWIYYPLSEISLENGFLLNLAYWGWIIGSIKSFSEIYVTYICLHQYKLREKIIIIVAMWGVTSANNNMVSILILSFFLLANIGLGRKIHLADTHNRYITDNKSYINA